MKIFERIIDAVIKKLKVNERYYRNYRARIVKVHESGGTTTEFEKPYSIDVKIIDEDGNYDETFPVITEIPVPVVWAGNNRGIYAIPEVGMECLVTFANGSPSQPYSINIYPAKDVPKHQQGNFLIQLNNGIYIQIASDGKIKVKGNTIILDGGGLLIDGVVTKNCNCAYTGAPHPVGSATVKGSN